MTRTDAIAYAHEQLRSGDFLRELDRRVAYPTESQNAGRRDVLRAYLENELIPSFAELDFESRVNLIVNDLRLPPVTLLGRLAEAKSPTT